MATIYCHIVVVIKKKNMAFLQAHGAMIENSGIVLFKSFLGFIFIGIVA